ncbi:MAG: putative nuclease, RecB family [Chloroflexi bacterium]|nr:MAG: putative nuclease, RecB family [Chloroflexota bacterium]
MTELNAINLEYIFSLNANVNVSASPTIKAHIIQNFSETPINVWCDYHVSSNNKDPITEFQQLMFSKGKKHHNFVNETLFNGATNLPFTLEADGFKQVLELMNQKVLGILDMPLICKDLDISGRPDVMRKVNDKPSVFGNHSYEIIEIKSAINIKTSHILQAAIYNRMIGKIQGFTPSIFYVINGNLEEFSYYTEEWDELLNETIQSLIKVINGEKIAPTLRGARWPWESYVNNLAIKANDASLVPGIKAKKRDQLFNAGLQTVNKIADASIEELTNIKGIGVSSAGKISACAKALASESIYIKQLVPQLPKSATQIFIDLEGSPEHKVESGSSTVNYLIGTIVRKNNSVPQFVSFFADTVAEEPDNTRDFFEWTLSLDDPVFFHWHNYEYTHLKSMGQRFNINDEIVNFVLDRMVDLRPIVLNSYAFPIYKEGLKEIARHLGFNWRLSDVDAMGSIALFAKFIQSKGTDIESKTKILTYNEDDCEATKFIFDWLTGNPIS